MTKGRGEEDASIRQSAPETGRHAQIVAHTGGDDGRKLLIVAELHSREKKDGGGRAHQVAARDRYGGEPDGAVSTSKLAGRNQGPGSANGRRQPPSTYEEAMGGGTQARGVLRTHKRQRGKYIRGAL